MARFGFRGGLRRHKNHFVFTDTAAFPVEISAHKVCFGLFPFPGGRINALCRIFFLPDFPEGIVSDGRSGGCPECHLFDVGAFVKCIAADVLHSCGNDKAAVKMILPECTVADVRQTLGKDKTAVKGTLSERFLADGFHALGNDKLPVKADAEIKCFLADGGHALRNPEIAPEASAGFKGLTAQGFQAVRQGQTVKAGAAVKCARFDGFHAIGNDEVTG